MAHRLKYGGDRNTPFSKAIGLAKQKDLLVLDTTAGLGRDAFIMASLGATVIACERNDYLFQLLQDGLKRAQEQYPDICARITLLPQDAIDFLADNTQQFDVIYCDPMFPQRQKSALVKKEMRVLKDIVGSDLDSTELLQSALAANCKRVVVKRAKTSPPVTEQSPSLAFSGKSNRFDVYLLPTSNLQAPPL